MILLYSSFLFAIVHIYGLCLSHWMGPAFYGMTVLSVANYAHIYRYNTQEFTLLRWVDYVYAHLLLVGTVWEACTKPLCPPMYIYWACLMWIAYVYRIAQLSQCPRWGDHWHATIHAATTAGSCALLYTTRLVSEM